MSAEGEFANDYDGINILLQQEGTYVKSTYTESWQIGPKNTKFFTRFYPAAKDPIASVVFAHGFQEHITRYDHVFNKVATQGNIDVFAFDQRGWGRTVLDTKNRSPGGSYGLTNRPHQLEDLEFFINKEAERVGSNRPVFLWGHSMGGGLVLSYGSSKTGLPATHSINRLSGIIASGPMVKQSEPIAGPLRIVLNILNSLVPWLPFPASVPNSYLTTDPRINAEASIDPLMKSYATIGCIHDFLAAGDQLAAQGYKDWPLTLPLYIVHGSADKACSPVASKTFFDGVPLSAEGKTYVSVVGSYHEIHNEPRWWVEDIDGVIAFIKARSTEVSTTAK